MPAIRQIFMLVLLLLASRSFANDSVNHLYRVTLLRAEPGHLPALIAELKGIRTRLNGDLLIMRHSQGDQWDLMLLALAGKEPTKMLPLQSLVAFEHGFLAGSTTAWPQIRQAGEQNGLYHIEMFHAVAGKKALLLKQRQMENDYYHRTQRAGNLIFTTTFGADVDAFTLGFYKDLSAFAATPDLPPETFEKAAVAAGFKNRDDIGFYLRELISSHHDTLATQVK